MSLRMVTSCILVLFMALAQADIYRSQDQNGNTVFTDRPDTGAERVELETSPYRYKVELKRVIDGDTLLLDSGEKVRLIGINTPEVDSRYSKAQPGGEAASKWLRQNLRSPYIWLEYDAEQLDKYDRLLAHVFLESGDYLNAMLLEEGLAMLTLTPPNLRYADSLIRAQQSAETSGKGIWRLPDYQLKTMATFKPGTNYTGWQRWQLTPKTLGEGRKYSSLIVSENLVISIPQDKLALFPPLQSYLDQSLEVRGWMRRQGSQHHILVQHPSALVGH